MNKKTILGLTLSAATLLCLGVAQANNSFDKTVNSVSKGTKKAADTTANAVTSHSTIVGSTAGAVAAATVVNVATNPISINYLPKGAANGGKSAQRYVNEEDEEGEAETAAGEKAGEEEADTGAYDVIKGPDNGLYDDLSDATQVTEGTATKAVENPEGTTNELTTESGNGLNTVTQPGVEAATKVADNPSEVTNGIQEASTTVGENDGTEAAINTVAPNLGDTAVGAGIVEGAELVPVDG